jgi:hypothetical protein
MMMQWDDEQRLEGSSRLGKEIWLKARDTGLPVVWGIVEDEVGLIVEDARHVIQRVRLVKEMTIDGSDYGYKAGAFVIDPNTGKVKWSQYSLAISERAYRRLLALGKARGWPLL